MKICPIAIAVGCKKCPMFKICPAKGLVGDYKPEEESANAASAEPSNENTEEESG